MNKTELLNPIKVTKAIFNRFLQIIFNWKRKQLITSLTGAKISDINRFLKEIKLGDNFMSALEKKFRVRKFIKQDFMIFRKGGTMFFHTLTMYVLTRIIKPEIVVETGGTPGKSSAFILKAMSVNNKGTLYTVDLPPADLKKWDEIVESSSNISMHNILPHEESSGWIVPNEFKGRHKIVIGKSSHRLFPLLKELKQIDMFIHDSEHSYENMLWEYRTAFPFIRVGGILLSDDVGLNESFDDFCKEVNCRSRVIGGFGAIKK